MVPLLLALELALATGGAMSGTGTGDDGPYLTWELRSEPIPDTYTKDHHWYQEAVVFHAPNGDVLWRRPLPERCKGWQVGIGDSEAAGHRDYPRTIHNLYFVIGLEYTEDAVAFADVTGVTVLSRKDGAVLLDAPFPRPEQGVDSLWFDSGSFTVGACSGGAGGGRFFSRCGGELFYFNGRTLAAIDLAKRRVTGTATFSREKHLVQTKATDLRATIPLGKRTFEIRGTIFMQ